MSFRVVGRYVQEGAANHIYASLNLFEPWTGQAYKKGIIYVQRSVGGRLHTTFYVNGPHDPTCPPPSPCRTAPTWSP